MKYKHNCFKCGKEFVIEHVIETDKPLCDKDFQDLLNVKNLQECIEFNL